MKLAIAVGSLAFASTAAADSFAERWSASYLAAAAFDPAPFHLQTAFETIPEEPISAWFKIVAALNRDSGRLDRDERRFVSYMLDKLTRNQAYVPSAPQAKWILHISAKLGRDLP